MNHTEFDVMLAELKPYIQRMDNPSEKRVYTNKLKSMLSTINNDSSTIPLILSKCHDMLSNLKQKLINPRFNEYNFNTNYISTPNWLSDDDDIDTNLSFKHPLLNKNLMNLQLRNGHIEDDFHALNLSSENRLSDCEFSISKMKERISIIEDAHQKFTEELKSKHETSLAEMKHLHQSEVQNQKMKLISELDTKDAVIKNLLDKEKEYESLFKNYKTKYEDKLELLNKSKDDCLNEIRNHYETEIENIKENFDIEKNQIMELHNINIDNEANRHNNDIQKLNNLHIQEKNKITLINENLNTKNESIQNQVIMLKNENQLFENQSTNQKQHYFEMKLKIEKLEKEKVDLYKNIECDEKLYTQKNDENCNEYKYQLKEKDDTIHERNQMIEEWNRKNRELENKLNQMQIDIKDIMLEKENNFAYFTDLVKSVENECQLTVNKMKCSYENEIDSIGEKCRKKILSFEKNTEKLKLSQTNDIKNLENQLENERKLHEESLNNLMKHHEHKVSLHAKYHQSELALQKEIKIEEIKKLNKNIKDLTNKTETIAYQNIEKDSKIESVLKAKKEMERLNESLIKEHQNNLQNFQQKCEENIKLSNIQFYKQLTQLTTKFEAINQDIKSKNSSNIEKLKNDVMYIIGSSIKTSNDFATEMAESIITDETDLNGYKYINTMIGTLETPQNKFNKMYESMEIKIQNFENKLSSIRSIDETKIEDYKIIENKLKRTIKETILSTWARLFGKLYFKNSNSNVTDK
ncbi:hypothetical protein A3Q56_05492 [Intoshia linei]|uniref:Uncharacterized protein n=1 Tax=Intoshia linei TaxID=1819745 RepID=A0A177B034_9BILA|nr:hypothetical protein A3Q56_05492 [Intoshia linei]